VEAKLVLLALFVLIIVGFMVWTRFWPYRLCRRCGGKKVGWGSRSRASSLCPHCAGKGVTIRYWSLIWKKWRDFEHQRREDARRTMREQ
jgi:hypothetical protein